MDINTSVTLDLLVPITGDTGTVIKSVTIRPPTVGDDIAATIASGTNADSEVRFFGILCGLSFDEMKRMHLQDYMSFQAEYQRRFFIGLPLKSETSQSTSAGNSDSPGQTS